MGKLIVIDGLDGSGKETQAKELLRRLTDVGKKVRKIEFPTYTKSSALIEMYLSGTFGNEPGDVNAYAASTFFAVDRYASFKSEWEEDYRGGAMILADRYTTSNAIHQLAKLPAEQRAPYLDWLWDFEFVKMGLPRPDFVLFLDMPPEYAIPLIESRYGGDEGKKDLHEKNAAYLKRCYEAALFSAARLGWQRVSCIRDGALRSIEDISEEIFRRVQEEIGS